MVGLYPSERLSWLKRAGNAKSAFPEMQETVLTAFPLKAIARLGGFEVLRCGSVLYSEVGEDSSPTKFEVLRCGSVLIFPTHEKTNKTAFASVFATLKRFARAFAAQTCICSLRRCVGISHVVFLFAAVAVSTSGKRSTPFAHETAISK